MAFGGDEDFLCPAVSEALAPVAHMEQEWDVAKLEKRIRTYFRNGAKGLEFGSKPWSDLIEEYADKVFGAMFQALSDRHWLSQADFLLVLDAGIKETFPAHVLNGVPGHMFETVVLNANDRAFEEQRYLPMLWETIAEMLQGPKIRKRAYDAFEDGRKNAAGCTGDDAGSPIGTFLQAWIFNTIGRLSADSQGYPDSIIEPPQCAQLFHALIGNGALPLPLVAEQGLPPPGWVFVDQVVGQAYAQAGCGGFIKGGAKGKGKGKAGGGCCGRGGMGGKGGGKAGFGGAGATNGNGATKRAAPSVAGAVADTKRPRGDSKGKGKGAPAVKGNPHCIQQEDCVGNSETDLVQHVDGETPGDVYCSACWGVFADADPSLTAMPCDTPC